MGLPVIDYDTGESKVIKIRSKEIHDFIVSEVIKNLNENKQTDQK